VKRVANQLFAAILVNSVYEMKNYPVVLVNTVLSPLSFLILIFFVSDGRLLGDAIEGGLIMTMFSSGTGLQSDLSHYKNDFKLQDIVVASPTPAAVYVCGIAISELIYSSPALAILVVLFDLNVHATPIQVLGIATVMVLMFLTSVSLGFALASISADIVQSFAYTRLLSTLFSTLPPVYYPITLIPLPFRYLAYLSPTTYASEIAQNLAGFLTLPGSVVEESWAVLLGLTAVFLYIGIRHARWRER
jgi:ABC-2 type transport system permease protein